MTVATTGPGRRLTGVRSLPRPARRCLAGLRAPPARPGDAGEREHRVLAGLRDELLDGRCPRGDEVWPGRGGDGQVLLEHRPGLLRGELPNGVHADVTPPAQCDQAGGPGVQHPRHRPVGRDQPLAPVLLDQCHRGGVHVTGLPSPGRHHIGVRDRPHSVNAATTELPIRCALDGLNRRSGQAALPSGRAAGAESSADPPVASGADSGIVVHPFDQCAGSGVTANVRAR